jgi:hypothetical protein
MEERAKARADRKSLLDAKKRAAEEEKLVSDHTCYFAMAEFHCARNSRKL